MVGQNHQLWLKTHELHWNSHAIIYGEMYFCVRTKKIVEIYEKPNHDSHSHYGAAAVPQVQRTSAIAISGPQAIKIPFTYRPWHLL